MTALSGELVLERADQHQLDHAAEQQAGGQGHDEGGPVADPAVEHA